MKKFVLFLLILTSLAFFPSGRACPENNFTYEIVKKEFLTHLFLIETVRAVIQGDNLSDESIKEALNRIIQEVSKQDNPGELLVYAYKEKEDAERAIYDFSSYVSLARAAWKPKWGGAYCPRITSRRYRIRVLMR